MAAIDFPASSASPFTAPDGTIYTWVTSGSSGYWSAAPTAADYLKLDASNDPITGNLEISTGIDLNTDGTASFAGQTIHEGGVKVTGTTSDSHIFADSSQYIQFGGNSRTLATFATDINNVGNGAAFGGTTCQLSTSESDINLIRCKYSNGGHGGGQNLALINNSVEANTSAQRVSLYQADSGSQQSGKLYAFYSGISNSDSSDEAYNFYAAGNASNYFKGGVNCEGELNIQVAGQGTSFPGFGNTITGFRAQPSGVGTFSANHANSTDFVTNFNRSNFNGTLLSFRKNGTERGSISIDDSNITILGQTSDYRVKKNIQPLASTADKVKALNIVNFEYTDRAPGVVQEGFVAHELAEICPKAVVGTKDAEEAIGTLTDVNGVVTADVTEPETMPYGETWVQTSTRPIYQGVDQTKLIPLLTKALQEALTEIDDLKARLDAAGV